MAAQNFVYTDMAYTLPAAECDFGLTAMTKGWINAAMFRGCIRVGRRWWAAAILNPVSGGLLQR